MIRYRARAAAIVVTGRTVLTGSMAGTAVTGAGRGSVPAAAVGLMPARTVAEGAGGSPGRVAARVRDSGPGYADHADRAGRDVARWRRDVHDTDRRRVPGRRRRNRRSRHLERRGRLVRGAVLGPDHGQLIRPGRQPAGDPGRHRGRDVLEAEQALVGERDADAGRQVCLAERDPLEHAGPRTSVTVKSIVPPLVEMVGTSGTDRLNVPRGPRRETSSRRSWTSSGSLLVFQLRLPRYCSASLTSAGVKYGRNALTSATAPVTCGAAIEVPELYAKPPGTVE